MSAILSAEALNDFIAPSVACIKPVESLPPPPPPSNDLTVAREDTLPAAQTAQTAAQISLTDCLACSGCVTSSEAVLVQLQSHTEVLNSLEQYPNRRFLAVVSPQTRAALAVALGMREKEAGNIVSRLLTTVGFEAVVDEGVFWGVEHWFASREVMEEASTDGPKKPILASSCPGFICYLESTHPELIPHLSALKSPQAIAGTFLKALLIGEGKAKSPEDVYVVGVMPCFDKKLEGARGELTSSAWRDESSEETPVRDIDCVITTRELLSLAEIKGINVRSLSREPVPTPQLSTDPTIQAFLSVATTNPQNTGTSGGNLSAILRSLLQQHPEATLQIQQGRNIDTVDYLLSSASGDVIAKFTRCYGFRNIQNLVRRLKPTRPKALPQFGKKPAAPAAGRRAVKRAGEARDERQVYVEVMACPGGCTNGGGQIKYDDEVLWKELGLEKWGSQRELLAKVDEAYFSSDEGEKGEEGEVRKVLDAWIRITGVAEEKLVKTTYRKVANDIGGRLGEKEVLEIASRTGGGW
ncbi:iron hydrogenase [Sphaerosporella brunnea]|uniref:Nuclear architecture-related protein 1 n=1 Tax=Sphaerosporella brunnea TaxID=1250544 RepID=A0A5J5EX38_9PEZI|nr:iron hydrogenase [Sphaerosporella brunnea]